MAGRVRYADEAAQTGASWALKSPPNATRCSKNGDQSEQLVHMNAERYPSEQLDWYFWCRRTGHGDEAGAQKLAEQRLPQLATSNDANSHQALGCITF